MKKTISNPNQGMQTKIFLLSLLLFMWMSEASAQSNIETGIKIFENKNYYGAEKFFTDFLKRNPDNAAANYYLGRIAMVNDKKDDAADFFSKATDLDGTNTWYFTWKGINYINILQSVTFMEQAIYAPKALSSLKKAVALDSMNALARTYLAGYYSQAPSFAGGSQEKAIEQINTAIAIDSTDPGFQLQRGIIMTTFKNYTEAEKSFENAINLNPEFFPAYLQMGRMSVESGQYLDLGESRLTDFINKAPADFDNDRDDAWYFLGNIYHLKGDNVKAKSAFEKAVSLSPDNEDYKKSLKNVM